jgi:DNA polymerase-3 subunit alpha
MSMFDVSGFSAPATGSILYPLPEVEVVSRREMLGWEKELVGVYVSEHPLQPVMSRLRESVTCFLNEIDESMLGQKVTVAGMVNWVRQIYTKNGQPMAFVEIEDTQSSIEIVVFSRLYEQTREMWQDGRVIVVRGAVDNKGGQGVKIVCESVDDRILQARRVPSEARESAPQPDAGVPPDSLSDSCGCHLQISIPRSDDSARDRQRIREIYQLLTSYPGGDSFSFCIQAGEGHVQYDFPGHNTQNCVELQQRLTQMLGATSVRVLPSP